VGLLDDPADNDLAVHRRHLARHVQPAIGLHGAGEGPWLAAACGAAGAVTRNAHGYLLVELIDS
jgi:hypothetical protein